MQRLLFAGSPTTEQKKDPLLAEQVHVCLVCLSWFSASSPRGASGAVLGLVRSPEAGRTSCVIQGFITLSESQSCLLLFFFCPYTPSFRAQSLESLRYPCMKEPTGQRAPWSRFVTARLLSHLLLPQHSSHGLWAMQNLWSHRAWECVPFRWAWQPQALCGWGEVRDLVGWSGGFQSSNNTTSAAVENKLG